MSESFEKRKTCPKNANEFAENEKEMDANDHKGE